MLMMLLMMLLVVMIMLMMHLMTLTMLHKMLLMMHMILMMMLMCVCRIKVPTGFAMMITSLQLLQMVVGCAINLMALNYKSRGLLLSKMILMIIYNDDD